MHQRIAGVVRPPRHEEHDEERKAFWNHNNIGSNKSLTIQLYREKQEHDIEEDLVELVHNQFNPSKSFSFPLLSTEGV